MCGSGHTRLQIPWGQGRTFWRLATTAGDCNDTETMSVMLTLYGTTVPSQHEGKRKPQTEQVIDSRSPVRSERADATAFCPSKRLPSSPPRGSRDPRVDQPRRLRLGRHQHLRPGRPPAASPLLGSPWIIYSKSPAINIHLVRCPAPRAPSPHPPHPTARRLHPAQAMPARNQSAI